MNKYSKTNELYNPNLPSKVYSRPFADRVDGGQEH